MTKAEREEMSDIVAGAVAIAIEKELGQYKVPKEQHYQDHLWINQMVLWQNNFKSSIWKSIANIIVASFFGLLMLGFIMWGKENL